MTRSCFTPVTGMRQYRQTLARPSDSSTPRRHSRPPTRRIPPSAAIRWCTTSKRSTHSCGCCNTDRIRETTSNGWLLRKRWMWRMGDGGSSTSPPKRLGSRAFQSRSREGVRWLDRAAPRLTGATLAGDELWFAWSVDRDSNHRPKPFVQIARIASTNLTLLENINIFDVDSATAYGALSTNADNEVGISYMLGGGPKNPTHVVGILTNDRKDVVVALGDRGPL